MKALYDYTAADTDEISIAQDEVLELVKEGQFKNYTVGSACATAMCYFVFLDESGWWTGKKTDGSQGFFPGAYVKKL